MKELDLAIINWYGPSGDPELSTMGALKITALAGGHLIPVTEVYDEIARTVRDHIQVPALPLARWLILNWWRIRWESEPKSTAHPTDWGMAHSIAAVGDGYAWPPLELASDGEFVQLHMEPESEKDVAAIRYLQRVDASIPAAQFESAVDEFILQVAERVSGCGLGNEIRDLFVELKEERADPKLSKACLLQARAGINPGETADGWLAELENLGQMTGDTSLEEVAAVLPFRKITPQAVREEIESIRDAKTVVDLSQVQKILPLKVQELPWARGSRLAAEFRAMLGLSPDKPILDDSLCDLLKIRLPIKEISPRQSMSGGFRNGQTHIHVSTWRRENQRFYLARLIACALLSGGEERLLPITNSQTALQKAERAFAQEFLCPWTALEPFVEEHGTEEEGISEAAEYFQVSERTIETTLVNKGELPRDAIV